MGKQFKRPNSTGSVYKLSGRRRRPWAASVSLGYDKNGRRIRMVIGCYETKTAALKALAQYDLSPTSRPNITLEQLYNEWSTVRYPKLSKSTADNYRSAYLKLAPLYKKKFQDLRTGHYQVIVDEFVNIQSRSSLEKYKALVGLLYNYAIMNDILNKNYGKFIELPTEVKEEKQRFSDLNIKKLFDKDDDHVVKIILVMIFTGFRPGAALALTRFSYNSKDKVLVGGIKTEAGTNRPIPVHPLIQKYIDYFLSLNGDRLLCRPDGRAYTLNNFRKKHYYSVLEKLDLPKLPPHRCRHTFISMLQTADVEPVSVLKLGGHKDYTFASNTYTHLELQKLRIGIDKMYSSG